MTQFAKKSNKFFFWSGTNFGPLPWAQKSKFWENEKNVPRFLPKDAKKEKIIEIGSTIGQLTRPEGSKKMTKNGPNDDFKDPYTAKKSRFQKSEKKPWRCTYKEAINSEQAKSGHPSPHKACAKRPLLRYKTGQNRPIKQFWAKAKKMSRSMT